MSGADAIPTADMVAWCESAGLYGEIRMEALRLLRAMDGVFRAHVHRKSPEGGKG